MLCAAPTVLIGIANSPRELRDQAQQAAQVVTAGAPPAAATIERIEGELGWVILLVQAKKKPPHLEGFEPPTPRSQEWRSIRGPTPGDLKATFAVRATFKVDYRRVVEISSGQGAGRANSERWDLHQP